MLRIGTPLAEARALVTSPLVKSDLIIGFCRITAYALLVLASCTAVAGAAFYGAPVAVGGMVATLVFHDLYQVVRNEQDYSSSFSKHTIVLWIFSSR